MKEYNKHC